MAYKADSDAIPIARANGVTAVASVPDGGILAGEVPVMKLDGWTWDEATVKPSAGPRLRLPGRSAAAAPASAAGPAPSARTRILKTARDRKLDDLARLLDQARAYAKAGPGRARDWTLEALVPVVERPYAAHHQPRAPRPTSATPSRSPTAPA